MVFSALKLDSVNRATTTLDGIAGKAINVAKVLKVLGEKPFAVGFLGGPRGEDLRAALRVRGIEHEFVSVPVHTRQCITVIDEEAGTQTELVEESLPVPSDAYKEMIEIVARRLPSCNATVMSGTLTPAAPRDFYRQCIILANKASVLTILDAKGEALEQALDAKPALIKPNRAELSATLGRDLSEKQVLRDVVHALHDRGARRVVVTAGKEPTVAFDGRQFCRIIAPAIRAVNPIGSGDSFTAALTWRLLQGDDLAEACRWGAAAGAANALTLMAAEVEREEVESLSRLVQVETLF